MAQSFQSRYLAVKSTAPVSGVVDTLQSMFPGSAIVYCTHDHEGTPHTHYCVRFPAVQRWQKFREWLMAVDPHSYSDSARSWPRSVRYLLHLDNPEKYQYSRSKLLWVGIDDDELSQILQDRSCSFEDLFRDLADVRHAPTGEAYLRLVRRGYRPAEISQVVRCLMDLDKFGTYTGLLNGAASASSECARASEDVEADMFSVVDCSDVSGYPDDFVPM